MCIGWHDEPNGTWGGFVRESSRSDPNGLADMAKVFLTTEAKSTLTLATTSDISTLPWYCLWFERIRQLVLREYTDTGE